MARLFGTDGIRGVANVDLKPTPGLRARPGDGPAARRCRRRDRRRPGHAPLGRHVRGRHHGRRDEPRRRRPRRRRRARRRPSPTSPGRARIAAGIMVSASHNPADDNGLKVLDADGLKLDDAIEDELEQLIWREGELGGVGNADLGRRIEAGERSRPTRPSAGPRRRRSDGAGARIVLDGANGSGGAVGVGHPRRRPGRRVDAIHVEPDGININVRLRRHRSGLARPRRSSRAAPTSGSRSMATPTGSSRSMPTGQVVDGDQVLGILALDRLARGALPGGLVVSILSNGGLQARGRGGRRRGRPDARRRQVHPRGDAGLGRHARWREVGPRHHPRAHHVGRRHRHRARGPAGHGPARRHAGRPRGGRSRSCPSNSARSAPVTRTSGRVTRSWAGPSPTRRPAWAAAVGSSSARPAPSPRCGSWSRARTRRS